MSSPPSLDTVLGLFADPTSLDQIRRGRREQHAQRAEELITPRVAAAAAAWDRTAYQQQITLQLGEEASSYESQQRARCEQLAKKVAELAEEVVRVQQAAEAQESQNKEIRDEIGNFERELESLAGQPKKNRGGLIATLLLAKGAGTMKQSWETRR